MPLLSLLVRQARRVPGISKLVALASGAGNCRGIFSTFQEASQATPRWRKNGYNVPEAAGLYVDFIDLIKPSDYMTMFWLRPLLPQISTLIDFGGNVGWSHYAFQKYLGLPVGLHWTVCDVPAVVARGEEIARERGAGSLSFVTAIERAGPCDVFLTSGTLQYLEERLPVLLKRLPKLPPHLFVNRVPLSDKASYFTLQDIGPSLCPYSIQNRDEFINAILEMGYRLVDSWSCHESSCRVRFLANGLVRPYSGFYFQA